MRSRQRSNRQQQHEEQFHKLAGLPGEQPSDPFTDRLMARLDAAGVRDWAQPQPKGKTLWRLRPELAHALVATAATYVFLTSGLFKLVFEMNPHTVEADLIVKVSAVMDWVGRVAEVFPS